jgi:xanthine/uracil permease
LTEPSTDDRGTWIRHFFYLALFTAAVHTLQCSAALLIWKMTDSAVLLSFGLDAAVSAAAALVLAAKIQQEWRNKFVAYSYMAASVIAAGYAGRMLWIRQWPNPTILGIVIAAVSMLVIPIIGSYMKSLAVELRSQPLKSAAIFTFGNSYLSMVLLIAMLMSYAMDLRWGDPLGSLVMFPFIAQKGIQILIEEGKHEYVED